MWTPSDRALVGDFGAGQALTDDQFRLLEPLIPPAWPGGRPRSTDLRNLLDGLFYLVRTGCQWRHLPPPPAVPPWRTIYGSMRTFLRDGVWESIRHHFVVMLRESAGREASPSAAIIDTQSVTTTESGGPRGWDAAKRLKGLSAKGDQCARSRWTPTGCCSAFSCMRPTSRMPMASAICCSA
jgi:putative transposase